MFDRLFGAREGDTDATRDPTPGEDPSQPATAPGADENVASIRQAISGLGSLSVGRRRFLASYAYVLVRVARADTAVDDAETVSMEAAVAAAGDVAEPQAALLVALAGRMNSLYGATEDYAVTREFARTSSPQERQRLMRACFMVGLADGPITHAESSELMEIGRELGFGLDEVDAIRQQVDTDPAEAAGSSSRLDDPD